MKEYLIKYIFVSILTISFCFSADNNIKVGDQAPSFFLTTLAGRKFFLSDELTIGKPILLNFFATWCGPCKKELPDIDAGNPGVQYNDTDGSQNDMGAYGGPAGDW